MIYTNKSKIQLSPRLRYGVQRHYDKSKLLKTGGILFLLLAAFITLNTAGVFGSDSKPHKTPQVLGAQDIQADTAPTQQFTEYTVKKGDTLFNLGQQYNVNWTTLMQLNNLDSPTLKTGQKIKIPTK
jgi:hypothetical protein